MEMEKLEQDFPDTKEPEKQTTGGKILDFITCKPTNNRRIRWLQHVLVLGILVAINLVVSSAIATRGGNSKWLDTLNNPPFRPPNWLFAPVWVVIYILIAFSAWRIYYIGKMNAFRAVVYIVSLLVNFIWVPVFFKYKEIFGGFVVIVLMLISIVVMMVVFGRVDTISMLALIPYLLWVTFATCLNAAYWWLNFDQFRFGSYHGTSSAHNSTFSGTLSNHTINSNLTTTG